VPDEFAECKQFLDMQHLEIWGRSPRNKPSATIVVGPLPAKSLLKRAERNSDNAEKRRILQMVCLNLVLSGTSLCISTRKPFNALVEGFRKTESGEDETRLELFYREVGYLEDPIALFIGK